MRTLSGLLCTALAGAFPLAGLASISVPEYTALQQYFSTQHGSAVFPVAGKGLDDVESTFGPRHQISTDKYDFHRGIDVDGTQGDNIVAPLSGVFWEYVEFQAGGHTVILRHTFDAPKTLNGTQYSHYYTYYMHLFDDGIGGNGQGTDDLVSGWTPEKTNPGMGTAFNPGDHIGEMGNSGSSGGQPYADHLHWELRVGATTSLIFQLDNLETTTQHGFDPHIHPMLILPPLAFGTVANQPVLTPEGALAPGEDFRVDYSNNDEQPLLNRVEITLVETDTDAVAKSHILDFNLRTGFDASDQDLLDNPVTTLPYLDPDDFGDTAAEYLTTIVVPEAWLANHLAGDHELQVRTFDIWGNEVAATYAPIPETRGAGVLAGAASLLLLARRHASRKR